MTSCFLFDLDGTLVDSLPGIADAYRYTFHALQLDAAAELDMHQFVGPSIREVLTVHFGLKGDRLEEGIRIFRSHYGNEGLLRFTKYEGVDEMLRALKNDGAILGIATGKLWMMAEQVIDHAGWTDLFTVVGGAKPDGSRFLKDDVIAWAIDQLPSGVAPLAMVGDRAADISGANHHGLDGIGVAWGYGATSELTDAGAKVIVESPEDLIPVLFASER